MLEKVHLNLLLTHPIILIAIPILLLGLHLLSNHYTKTLHRIPGPFLASTTNLWRLLRVRAGHFHLTQIDLHERYGPVVRLGPNVLSIADPQAIKTIYAIRKSRDDGGGFVKSEFYPVQQQFANGARLETLFTTTDPVFHGRLRRAVGNAYALSSLLAFEPLVDSTILAFLGQLEKRFVRRPAGDDGKEGEEGVCDFGTWLQYFAFDVIGELTYSKRLGFVDRGEDVDGIIGNVERNLNYFAVAGQMPILDRLIVKNPLRLWLSKWGWGRAITPVAVFARDRMTERNNEKADWKEEEGTKKSRDFLSRFQEAHTKDPEFMPQQRVLAVTVANIFAGSDTTAITLRAIFYHLLRDPETMKRLRQELERDVVFDGDGLAAWSSVHELPYLSAVIKEALRCHPAAGLSLERVVPSSGLTVGPYSIPPGTIVGCNAWVIHRSESIFGAHTELFRPERWLEANETQRNEMNNMLFSFGAGTRSCIGKNISLLEMYKLVPALLHRFEISFARPQTEWKLFSAWFVRQSEFYVRVRTRQDHGA